MVQKWLILGYLVKGGGNQPLRVVGLAREESSYFEPSMAGCWAARSAISASWVPLGCSIGVLGGFMRDLGYQHMFILVALASRNHGESVVNSRFS